MSDEAPPAGWYPNPDGTGGLRWWSGVGWTEYTRSAPAQAPEDEVRPGAAGETAGTSRLDGTAQPTGTSQWDATGEPGPGGWTPAPAPEQQPAQPPGTYGPYGRYAPPPPAALTPSGMRPLAAMFSDISRITRRAWWPILAVSLGIWAAVAAILGVLTALVIDIPALRVGLDNLQSVLESSPDGTLTDAQLEALGGDFGAVFDRLPAAGWVLAGLFAGVLFLLAGTVHVAAVSRLAMDASTGQEISWGAAMHSGVTAGFRLFGYYLLMMVAATAVVTAAIVAAAVAALLTPALGVAVGILAFFALLAATVWLTGRLIPTVAQAVVAPRALAWSWRATKGKVWAVLGRYILWSIAASVIVNVVLTVVSIPVSAVFLGQGAESAEPLASLVPALTLNLVLLPLSMAAGAVTVVGIVPIWRDLTDHPVYRGIDENGLPMPAPVAPGAVNEEP
jgi:hypothetical protein